MANYYKFLEILYSYEPGIYDIIKNMVFFRPKTKYDLNKAIQSLGFKKWFTTKPSLEHIYQARIRYGPIEIWDTSLITDMSYLFYNYYLFNIDISNWDVSNVTTMKGMFEGCQQFNNTLDKWDVSKVTNMDYMFKGATTFNKSLEKWGVNAKCTMKQMFEWDTRNHIINKMKIIVNKKIDAGLCINNYY